MHKMSSLAAESVVSGKTSACHGRHAGGGSWAHALSLEINFWALPQLLQAQSPGMSETPAGRTGEGLWLVLVAGLLLLNVGLILRPRHISTARHHEQAGMQQVGTPGLFACLITGSSVKDEAGPVLHARGSSHQARQPVYVSHSHRSTACPECGAPHCRVACAARRARQQCKRGTCSNAGGWHTASSAHVL